MFTKHQTNSPIVALALLASFFIATPVSAVDLQAVSTRGLAGPGVDNMVVGVTILGSGGTGSKMYLFAAMGPSTGIPSALADPKFTLFRTATGEPIVSCDNWKTCVGADIVGEFLDKVGQTLQDQEAAIAIPLIPGSYTLHIEGADDNIGVALGSAIELTGTETQ